MTQSQAMTELDIPRFSSQMDGLNLLLLDLQSLLQTESQTLKNSDASALTQSTQAKSELMDKIDSLVQKINQNFPNLSENKHFFDLAKEKAFASISNELQEKVDNSLTLSQACHDLNMANGMAIQILSNINQVSLQILTGQNQTDSNLYGSTGTTTQNKSKSSLGKA